MRSPRRGLALGCALALAPVLSGAAPLACVDDRAPRDAVSYLERLHILDELPILEPAHSELAANYDPEGGNDLDGRVYPWVDGYRNLLLDVDGPGCIHRISTGDLAAVEGTLIEIRLDDGELLTMPVTELFDPDAGPFAGGLVHAGPYPEVRYPTVRMPIPFAEHAEVRLISPDARWGVFWQIGYTRYDDGRPVETLRLPLDPRTQAALDDAGEAWDDAVSGAQRPPRADIELRQRLEPGEALTWTESGCGTIERLRVELPDDSPTAWRRIWIRAVWDDADTPAFELPLAEFMGAGDYANDPDAWFDSLVMGAEDDRAWLRLPMPYRDAARIELLNLSTDSTDDSIEVGLELWRRRCVDQPADTGYLHAAVAAAEAATPDSPRAGPQNVPVHRLLERQGRGKVVGVVLRVNWPWPSLWWGEGDWQIWTDQPFAAWPPRHHGTGTEEFFDGGWTRFERKALSGYIKTRPGRVTIYGFLLNDALSWERHIRMQVETVGLGVGDFAIQTYHPRFSSTVLWYDQEPGGAL